MMWRFRAPLNSLNRNAKKLVLSFLVSSLALTGLGCGETNSDEWLLPQVDLSSAPEASVSTEPSSDGLREELRPQLPVTIIDVTGTEVTVESVDRIIPLDGTVAEVVFALGLGPNVVATDMSATYPAEADSLPEIGYQRALSAETIAVHSPTVLLATDIAGPPGVIDDLRKLGFALVIVPNASGPNGPPEKIQAVAEALGITERGKELANRVEAEIESATVTDTDYRPTVVSLYLRGASTQLVLGRNSATHWIVEAAGGQSMAEILDLEGSESISAEGLIVASPEVILVPSAGLESVGGEEGLAQIGGLSQTPAVENGAIVHFDDQWLLGNGPRVASLIEELSVVISDVREKRKNLEDQ